MLSFIKIVNTQYGQTFAEYHGAANDLSASAQIAPSSSMQYITKLVATKIDSLFITFHTSDRSKADCVQPYIQDFKITIEEAGNQMYL